MLKKIFASKTVTNASWLIGGRIAQVLINLVVGLLTARYLGPSNFGLINYASAYTAFFAAFCTLGINSVLVKELIDNPDEEGTVLGTSLFFRAMSSILSAIVIICIVYGVDKGDPTTMAVVALSCVGMIFQIFEVFYYWFQSKLWSKVKALVSLVAYIITAAYRVVLLALGKSVVWFAFATAVDYIAIAIMIYIAYRKKGGGRLRVSFEVGKQILRKSCHFILPSLMVAIYAQTDKIMLKQMINETEIGYYSTALSICNVWCFVLSAIIDSLYPDITKAYNSGDVKLFNRRNKQLYAIVFYVSVVVSALITLLAEPAIGILYGAEYLPAVVPLRVITWYTAFSYLGVARNAWIVCENRQKYLIYVYASAAISNVFFNLLLIPRLGAVGAAIASLIAQIMTTMIAPFFIKGLRENSKLMIEAILLKGILKK